MCLVVRYNITVHLSVQRYDCIGVGGHLSLLIMTIATLITCGRRPRHLHRRLPHPPETLVVSLLLLVPHCFFHMLWYMFVRSFVYATSGSSSLLPYGAFNLPFHIPGS